jgi:hypothetical protein
MARRMTHAGAYAGVCFVLCALVAALNLRLIVDPDQRRAVWERAGREPAGETFAQDALQHELRRLRDGRGVIPPNAYGRAKAQLEVLKRRGAARRIALGDVAPIGPRTSGTSAAPSVATVMPSQWRWLGPGNIGGRVRSIAIDPTNPTIVYVGSAGGGVWKTTDGGGSWFPLDDFMAVLSVSSVVIDPANPQILYAGTGEGFGNADGIFGAGIFKSIDGGTTWTQLSETSTWQAVNRLATSSDGAILLAATNMGMFRSANGGRFSARGTPGIQDVVFDPNDNARVVASGPVGPMYSWDGGLNWQWATGVPGGGRVELAWARSSPSVVFASVDVNGGVLYRSNDAGATYSAVYTAGNLLGPQGWYDNAIWVNPRNSNHLLVGGVGVRESLDGGATWKLRTMNLHADQHAIVEDPRFDGTTNKTVYFGTDGGVFRMPDVTVDGASSVQNLNNNLGVTQFYAGAGNAATGVILGGTQDNGTVVLSAGGGTSAWRQALCCDGGYAAVDPTSSFMYGSIYYLHIYRSNDAGSSWRLITSGLPESGVYANFIAPFVVDPNNPALILAGGSSLWRTQNAFADTPTWKQIIGFGGRPYFNAIAIAPNDSNVVWAARDSFAVYKATDATAATPSFFALTVPTDGKLVTRISISPADSNVVYVTTGGFTANNILKTSDGGTTWTVATGSGASGLPAAPINDLAIDPRNPTTIYAASEVGVFVSSDGGTTWDLPQDGPANVRVDQLFWMGTTLVAATHGRGMFAVDSRTSAAPAVGISPAALDFGRQTVGTSSAPRAITVTDTGSAALTIAGVALAGSNPSQFAITTDGCTGRTVAPGAACTVDVVFRPTTATASSATFVVQSNAASSRDDIGMSGTGVALRNDVDGEVVLYARDAAAIHGNWQIVSDPTAAGVARVWNPDARVPKIATAAASPSAYFELTFQAQADKPYHLWLRMKADDDWWANDSVYVQFSDSVDRSGNAVWRTGTTSATVVSLEDCTGCGEHGWGWNDNGYGIPGPNVYFPTTGEHTIRIQQREDGISIDQVVLSSRTYLTSAPGDNKDDATILVQSIGAAPRPPLEIVMYVAPEMLPASHNWFVLSDGTAAQGARLYNPNQNLPKSTSPLSSYPDYFDVRFSPEAGTPYHLWVRGKADDDYWTNDSVFVQFSDSVDASGNPIWRVNTNSATVVSLEDCTGCGEQGWGWQDNAYGAFAAPMYFGKSGPQTIRVIRREDGFSIDQIVISAGKYLNTAPGALKNDTTIVPR